MNESSVPQDFKFDVAAVKDIMSKSILLHGSIRDYVVPDPYAEVLRRHLCKDDRFTEDAQGKVRIKTDEPVGYGPSRDNALVLYPHAQLKSWIFMTHRLFIPKNGLKAFVEKQLGIYVAPEPRKKKKDA